MKKMVGGLKGGNRASRRGRKSVDGGGGLDADGSGSGSGPSGERLNRLYAALLEELAIPESKRAEMLRTETDDRKQALLNAHSAMVKMDDAKPGTEGGAKKRSAEYWVDLISRRRPGGAHEPVITVAEAGELCAVLRTAHKQFLMEFVDRGGVEMLIDLTRWFTGRVDPRDTEKQILPQLLTCYKALMNTNAGMEAVLAIPDSVTSFALALDLGGDDAALSVAQEIVMLLAVTCFFSPEGREMVVQAMDDLRVRWREKQRFQTLVEAFSEAQSNEFKAAVSMLVTTVVNSAALVEDRVRVRNDFLALDIMGVFERVLADARDDDDEAFHTIATQFQVFEDMLAEDHREVTFALIAGTSSDDADVDLSSQSDVFDFLLRSARGAGCADLLLEVTQALLLVPGERSLAVPTWKAVLQFVMEATDYAKSGGARKGLRLNYQLLSDLLDRRAELDERLGQLSSGNDIIGQQRQKIRDLEARLASGDGRASKSVGKGGRAAKAAAAAGVKGDADAAAGSRQSTSEEVKILQGQLEQLRAEIAALQKELAKYRKGKPQEDDPDDGSKASAAVPAGYSGTLDSTGLRPAGLVPGVKQAKIPACPQPNMKGSLELAPIPAKSGAPSTKPAAAKGKKGAAPAGGAAAAAAAAAAKSSSGGGGEAGGNPLAAMLAARAGGAAPPAAAAAGAEAEPAAPVVSPKEAEAAIRKRLGLPNKKPISPGVKMKHIYWTPVPVDKLEGTVWPELSDQKVKLDAKRLERKFGQSAESSKAAVVADAKRKSLGLVHLVTGRRQQNVGIALSKIRASDAEVVEALWTMDETLLTPEHTLVLLSCVPTEDELELLRNFEEGKGDVRKLAREDQFMRAVSVVPRLQQRLQAVQTTHTFESDATRIDDKVRAVREACVELNRSSDLQQLLQIVLAIGNYLNGSTPRGAAWGFKLDALAKLDTIKDNSGKRTLMDFLFTLCERNYPNLCDFALPKAEEALHVSLSDTMAELNQLASALRAIKTELGQPPANKRDRFHKVFAGFEVRAAKRVADLQTAFEKTRADFQALARRFAETGAGVEPETFFSKFVRFQMGLQRAKRQVQEARERAERARRLAEEKKRRATLKKLREMEAAGADDGVFAQFARANAGDAADIVQGFLRRNRTGSTAAVRKPKASQQQQNGRAAEPGSRLSQASTSTSGSKKMKQVKIIRTTGPNGEIIVKKVRLKKKKKKPVAASVPNADFDVV